MATVSFRSLLEAVLTLMVTTTASASLAADADQMDPAPFRSRRDLSADRRHLYALRSGDRRSIVRTWAACRDLGVRVSRYTDQSFHTKPLPRHLRRIIRDHGLAWSSGDPAAL